MDLVLVKIGSEFYVWDFKLQFLFFPVVEDKWRGFLIKMFKERNLASFWNEKDEFTLDFYG